MDIVTKYMITSSVVFVVAVVVAILCHKAEKKIEAMDNLKDVDDGR